jgi:hypothetical protein
MILKFNIIMINLAAKLILVSVIGFLFALVGISCLTLFQMNNIINQGFFKLGKHELYHPECSARADLREG